MTTRQYVTIWCDGRWLDGDSEYECGRFIEWGNSSSKEVRAEAKLRGWQVNVPNEDSDTGWGKRQDFCHEHKKQRVIRIKYPIQFTKTYGIGE